MAHLTALHGGDEPPTDDQPTEPPMISGFCRLARCTECKRRRIAGCKHSCHDQPPPPRGVPS